jgi:hypothetical protein
VWRTGGSDPRRQLAATGPALGSAIERFKRAIRKAARKRKRAARPARATRRIPARSARQPVRLRTAAPQAHRPGLPPTILDRQRSSGVKSPLAASVEGRAAQIAAAIRQRLLDLRARLQRLGGR